MTLGRFLFLVLGLVFSLIIGNHAVAQSAPNCFVTDQSTTCLSMTRNGSSYDIRATQNGIATSLHCQVKTPDGKSIFDYLRGCNDSFVYNGGTNGTFLIYVTTAGSAIHTLGYDIIANRWDYRGTNTAGGRPQASSPTQGNNNNWDNNNWNNNNSQYAAKLLLSLSPVQPRTNDLVSMTIQAVDSSNYLATNYTNRVAFAVSYRTSSSARRILDSTQKTYQRNGGPQTTDFVLLDRGSKTLLSSLRFLYPYEYRITLGDGRVANSYLVRVTNNGGASTDCRDSSYCTPSRNDNGQGVQGTASNFGIELPSQVSAGSFLSPRILARTSSNQSLNTYRTTLAMRLYKQTSNRERKITFGPSNANSTIEMGNARRVGSLPFDQVGGQGVLFQNLVKIFEEGVYRLEIYDPENTRTVGIQTFTVLGSSATQFSLQVSPSSPRINTSVSLLLDPFTNGQRNTNYRGNVSYMVYRENGGRFDLASSSDVIINRSSDLLARNNFLPIEITNLLQFRTSGTYRIRVIEQYSNASSFIDVTIP